MSGGRYSGGTEILHLAKPDADYFLAASARCRGISGMRLFDDYTGEIRLGLMPSGPLHGRSVRGSDQGWHTRVRKPLNFTVC